MFAYCPQIRQLPPLPDQTIDGNIPAFGALRDRCIAACSGAAVLGSQCLVLADLLCNGHLDAARRTAYNTVQAFQRVCVSKSMNCRVGCGACCIAPSVSSPIPGMPHGKPAGVRCAQLTPDNRCLLFGQPERPAVCASLRPSPDMCGNSASEAMHTLRQLEMATTPLLNSSSRLLISPLESQH